jgi:hypothetical protein
LSQSSQALRDQVREELLAERPSQDHLIEDQEGRAGLGLGRRRQVGALRQVVEEVGDSGAPLAGSLGWSLKEVHHGTHKWGQREDS